MRIYEMFVLAILSGHCVAWSLQILVAWKRLHTYIRTYVRTYLPTYVPIYLPAYVHTCTHTNPKGVVALHTLSATI